MSVTSKFGMDLLNPQPVDLEDDTNGSQISKPFYANYY